MVRFSSRTINETYREQRGLGDDDLTARAMVNERLQAIYGEVPTEAELNEAARHYDATEPTRRQMDIARSAQPMVSETTGPIPTNASLTTADFAGRDDIATALDVPCPFCGAEPQQSCTENGAPYPPHRGRVVLAQDIVDARARQK